MTRPVFFASSDPGGAQEICSVIRYLRSVSSDQPMRLFTDSSGFRVDDSPIPYETATSEQDVRTAFDREKPACVVTGTSNKAEVEWNFLKVAKSKSVKSAALIDHWTNFSSRFQRNGEVVWPDRIFVNDAVAYDRAVEGGLPKDRLEIFGNPYFEETATYVPQVSREAFSNSPYILFLSDCLTEVEGSEALALKRYGYTELSIFTALLESLSRVSKSPTTLIVKLHPHESLDKWNAVKDGFKKVYAGEIKFVLGNQLRDLIYFSERVCGMFSAALLQAVAMRKNCLRVELNSQGEDYLPVSKSFFVDRVLKPTDLDRSVKNWLQASPLAKSEPLLPKNYPALLSVFVGDGVGRR